MIRLPSIRFRLRTLLILVSLSAIYLTWRLRDPTAQVAALIKANGGMAYCQDEITSAYSFSSPSETHHTYTTLTVRSSNLTLGQSIKELVFGPSEKRSVSIVVLPLEKITPEIVRALTKLPRLQQLVVVPATMPVGSESGELLKQLKQQFVDELTVSEEFETDTFMLSAIVELPPRINVRRSSED